LPILFCSSSDFSFYSIIRFHLNQRRKNAETPGGSIGQMRPRSATARGGSSAAPRKAKHFSAAVVKIYPYISLKYSGYHSSFMLNVLVMSKPLLFYKQFLKKIDPISAYSKRG